MLCPKRRVLFEPRRLLFSTPRVEIRRHTCCLAVLWLIAWAVITGAGLAVVLFQETIL